MFLVAPPPRNFPFLPANTSCLATTKYWAAEKLQWLVPGAAGVVVIGIPAEVNVVYAEGVVLQIESRFFFGGLYWRVFA